ncbi:MAG: hypothetical protein IT364_17070 [Candidatus Hydrogenedentes bacterium]|nr:hypothetical protein [Candidatus Hydrogenedentota bacterium]
MATQEPANSRNRMGNGPDSLRRIRKEHIERVLRDLGNDLEEAARILGITVKELRRCMHKLGIAE